MPPRFIPILARRRQDLAAVLSREAIEAACRQSNHSWRRRLLDPAATVYLFLLQVLHGNTACQHVVHFGNWSFTDSAYCQARKRLPLRKEKDMHCMHRQPNHILVASPGPPRSCRYDDRSRSTR